MTMLASALTASMRFTLLDASKVTFSDAELLGYLSEGLYATCGIKTEANVLTESFALAGGTPQFLSDDTISGLVEVLYNTPSGSPITLVSKKLLQVADPEWASQTRVAEIKHYMFDPTRPRHFDVYPPAIADSLIVIKVTQRPSGFTNLTDLFPISETYAPMVIDYALSRAYMKNSKKQDTAKAGFYYQQWAQAVGLRSRDELLSGPKAAPGGDE